MNTQLKQAITNFIFDNLNEFQLVNATTRHFRPYIYDAQGEYLYGGKQVTNFIKQATQLITTI